MTQGGTQQPKPKHCDHECVCLDKTPWNIHDSVCTDFNCEHDTRTHDTIMADRPQCLCNTCKVLVNECRAKNPTTQKTPVKRKENCCNGCEADLCAEICQTWINEHDTALITSEREKWEKEHTPKFHAENPKFFTPWYNVEMVAARVEYAQKKAREDVIAVAQHIADTIPDFNRMDYMMELRTAVSLTQPESNDNSMNKHTAPLSNNRDNIQFSPIRHVDGD